MLAYRKLLPTSSRIFSPQLNLFGNILIDTPYRYVSMMSLNLNKMAVKVEYHSPFPSKSLEYLTEVQMPWPKPGPLNLCWATRESAFCLDPFDSDACNHISRPANVHLILQLRQAYMFCFSFIYGLLQSFLLATVECPLKSKSRFLPQNPRGAGSVNSEKWLT